MKTNNMDNTLILDIIINNFCFLKQFLSIRTACIFDVVLMTLLGGRIQISLLGRPIKD